MLIKKMTYNRASEYIPCMETKLSPSQVKVLKSALTHARETVCPYALANGYSPCVKGFARTAWSLIRLDLATGTGLGLFGEGELRGIILTPKGKALAETL